MAIDGERGGWGKGIEGIDKALWKEKKFGCLNCGTEASIYTLSAALAEAKSVCIVWMVWASLLLVFWFRCPKIYWPKGMMLRNTVLYSASTIGPLESKHPFLSCPNTTTCTCHILAV